MQAAACDCVCDPCGCWRWVMACRGTACAGWSVHVYTVFRVCTRWVCVSCTRRLCLVKRCVCGWLQTLCTVGGVMHVRVCISLWGCELRVPTRCAGLQPVCKL